MKIHHEPGSRTIRFTEIPDHGWKDGVQIPIDFQEFEITVGYAGDSNGHKAGTLDRYFIPLIVEVLQLNQEEHGGLPSSEGRYILRDGEVIDPE